MAPLDFPKLRWAHDQLNGLQTYGKEWFGGEHHRFTSEPDQDPAPFRRGNRAFYVEVDPLPAEFSLRVGEVLQGLRSGLDHLAYALATAHTQPLPDEWAELSEFPIFGDESKAGTPGTGSARFHQASKGGVPVPASGLAKIQGIAPAAQAIIEGLQPYHRGADYRDDPLWRLHELSRIDKHRLVHVVAADFDGVGIDTTRSYNWDWRPGPSMIYAHKGPVEGRTLVGSLPVRPKVGGKKMHVEVVAPFQIAFGAAVPLVAGDPVISTLGAIHDYIYKRVLKPLVGFLVLPPGL